MKKILIFAIVLLFSSLALAGLPDSIDAEVTISNLVQNGDTVTITFNLENTAQLAGLQFEVCDTPNVLELIPESLISLNRLADVGGLTFTGSENDEGITTFIWFSMSLSAYIEGNEEHIEAKFLKTVPEEVALELAINNVVATDVSGNDLEESSGSFSVTLESTGPEGIGENALIAKSYQLNQNYPNPFNPTTSISYVIPSREVVSISVYDLKGNFIRNLVNGVHNSGTHSVVWDAKDTNGMGVASGVYVYRLESLGKSISKKMMLMR